MLQILRHPSACEPNNGVPLVALPKRLMFKPSAICCCLCLWSATVLAQPEKAFSRHGLVDTHPSTADADLQARRAALRAALRVQQEKSHPSESVPRRAPELSAPERAQLRQQLREQRR